MASVAFLEVTTGFDESERSKQCFGASESAGSE